MLRVAWSPVYRYELPEGHRFPMIKYDLLPEQLVYEGTLSEDQFFQPEPLVPADILRTHTPGYWAQLQDQTLSTKEIRRIGFPMTPQLVDRGMHIAMGTLACARFALDHGVALNTAGGTHHGFADHGEGFCIFNDVAVASNILLATGEAHQILVVDLDVHQGNGTASIFREDPRVFTFSMHGERNYPLRKETSDLDVGLPDGMTDKDYLSVLDRHLESLLDRIAPDLVFYVAGVDVLETDLLGRLRLTREGCRSRDLKVFRACRRHGVPVSVSMGGGYSRRLADILDAHANTFRAAQEVYF